MRIAFYAPLKAPDHPVPSGDRTIARLLLAALKQGGATVEIASRIRTRISDPTEAAQEAMAKKGAAAAKRLIAKYRARPKRERPQAWFSYHLYYKAVDWIGQYRRHWEESFDRLDEYLQELQTKGAGKKGKRHGGKK